jgi:hypothetical protein
MLDLTRGRPVAAPVPLGGGAVAMIRPATAFEVDKAGAQVRIWLAALVEAEDAAARLSDALGEEFAGADFAAPEWRAAVADRLALLELASLCIQSWSGVGIGDEPVEPSREAIALLLRDAVLSQRIRAAIERGIHVERLEKKGLPVSPPGAGEAAAPIAPNAGDPPPPAQ